VSQKKYELDPNRLPGFLGMLGVTFFIFGAGVFHWFNWTVAYIGSGICTFLFVYLLISTHRSKIPRSERLKSDDSRYVSSEVRQAVWRRDHGRCVICGSQRKLHYDHIIPFSKGGSNTEKNIRILCEKCNLRKSDKIE